MAKQSKILNDEVIALAEKALKTMRKSALLAKKLEAVIAAKEHGISLVAKVYSISRTTLTEWIKHVKNNELERLQAPPQRKRKHKIDGKQSAQIKEWIAKNPQITLEAIKLKLGAEYGLVVSIPTVQSTLKKMKYSYITPRPEHANKTEKRLKSLKKNISSDLARIEHTKVFFFDESRFGTHSKLGHGWFQTGSRSSVKIKYEKKELHYHSIFDKLQRVNEQTIVDNKCFEAALAYINQKQNMREKGERSMSCPKRRHLEHALKECKITRLLINIGNPRSVLKI